jgi:hypothetical protein
MRSSSVRVEHFRKIKKEEEKNQFFKKVLWETNFYGYEFV